MAKTVFVQNWEESERGWGTRPDGFTVHISKEQWHTYVDWYNTTFNSEKTIPDEYTRVCGKPREVQVSDELYARLEKETTRDLNGRIANAVWGEGRFFDSDKTELTKDDLRPTKEDLDVSA